jgi:hypothetical protein
MAIFYLVVGALIVVACLVPTKPRRRVSSLSEADRLAWVERDRRAWIEQEAQAKEDYRNSHAFR